MGVEEEDEPPPPPPFSPFVLSEVLRPRHIRRAFHEATVSLALRASSPPHHPRVGRRAPVRHSRIEEALARHSLTLGVEEEDEPPAPPEPVNPSGLPSSHPSHQSRHPHPSPSLPVRPERSETVSLPDLPRSEVSPSHEVEGPTPDDEDTNAPTILAVDVARFGADQSVLLLASPTAVLRLEAHHGLDTMQLAVRVVDAHRHWSPARPPDRIVVDEIGVGAGVVDRLKELGLPVTGINVGRPARQRTLFANLRAEGYWRLRELFSQDPSSPSPTTPSSQASSHPCATATTAVANSSSKAKTTPAPVASHPPTKPTP